MRLCPHFREQKDVHGKTESTLEKLPLVETYGNVYIVGASSSCVIPPFALLYPLHIVDARIYELYNGSENRPGKKR